jgi:hypothetical protein
MAIISLLTKLFTPFLPDYEYSLQFKEDTNSYQLTIQMDSLKEGSQLNLSEGQFRVVGVDYYGDNQGDLCLAELVKVC